MIQEHTFQKMKVWTDFPLFFANIKVVVDIFDIYQNIIYIRFVVLHFWIVFFNNTCLLFVFFLQTHVFRFVTNTEQIQTNVLFMLFVNIMFELVWLAEICDDMDYGMSWNIPRFDMGINNVIGYQKIMSGINSKMTTLKIPKLQQIAFLVMQLSFKWQMAYWRVNYWFDEYV